MRKAIIKNFLFYLLIYCAVSCETREAFPRRSSDGSSYFPIEKGIYSIFKVDEINYSVILGNSTKTYFLKEEISDSIIDDFNNVSFKILRYKTNELNTPWKIDSVWTVRKTEREFIKVENNVPFVKIVTPIAEGKEWNGNSYNTRGEEKYRMEKIDQKMVLNDKQFDSTLVQIQKKDSSSISQDYRIEIYARGIGLIQKRSVISTNLQSNGSIVIPIKIDKGVDYTQTLIEHGKN